MDIYAWGFLGLFFITFLSATLIPLASEAFFLGFLMLGYDPFWTLMIATAGNSLGSFTNYGIGRLGNPMWLKRFGATEAQIHRWEEKVNRFGHWTALVTWIPFIGDPITVAMGFFRTHLLYSFILITAVKCLRYVVIWWMWSLV
jgi:membrane protein YqaA with SNARE-associated domain